MCVCVGPGPPLAQEALGGLVEEGLLGCFPVAVAVVMVAETKEGQATLVVSPCVYSCLRQGFEFEGLLLGGNCPLLQGSGEKR